MQEDAADQTDDAVPPDARLLRLADVQRIIPVSERTLDRLANEGRLPKVKLGRTTFWRLNDVVEFSRSL